MKHLFLILTLLLSFICISNAQAPDGMVFISGGEFIMGKNSDRPANFSPAHPISVPAFYMDIHEVTNRQYLEFCKASGHNPPEFWGVDMFHCSEKYLDYPVVGINWYDAVKYAKWVGKRLPTEAEWEYAARGGLIDNEFPNGNEWTLPLRRNEPGSWENLTVSVRSFEPNAYGLYNMGGNVWELCNDVYEEDYYQHSSGDNPTGPERGGSRVIRGGGWRSGKMCHKVYYRKGIASNWVDFAVGFRCVQGITSDKN